MSRGVLSLRVIAAWSLFAVLATVIVALEGGALTPHVDEHAKRSGARERVFHFSEPDLGALEVVFEGQRMTLMRDDEGHWFKHDASHRHDSGTRAATDRHQSNAQQATEIKKQLQVSARMLADRRVKAQQALAEYGLEKPSAIFTFYPRKGDAADFAQPLALLYVGDLLPTQYAYYSLLDGDQDITVLPRYQVALLLALAFGSDVAPTPLPEGSNAQR